MLLEYAVDIHERLHRKASRKGNFTAQIQRWRRKKKKLKPRGAIDVLALLLRLCGGGASSEDAKDFGNSCQRRRVCLS